MSKLLTIAASATDGKSLDYCPEIITFVAGAVPTSLKIEVEGEVIFSLDGTGITNLNGIRCVGALPANQYVFQISDGRIEGSTTITMTTDALGGTDILGFYNSRGTMFVKHQMQKAFANVSKSIVDIAYAAFPSASATDTFTVTFADGTSSLLLRSELEALLAYTQDVTATRYSIDNYERTVKRIDFLGAADQSIYFTKYFSVK
jgi:hypothetical protein